MPCTSGHVHISEVSWRVALAEFGTTVRIGSFWTHLAVSGRKP